MSSLRIIFILSGEGCLPSYCFCQNHKLQSPSLSTASINISVIRTEQLKYRNAPSFLFSVINSSISGEDMSRQAICAPRRAPPDKTVEHTASKIFIKDITPDVSAPAPYTNAPLGLIVLKS